MNARQLANIGVPGGCLGAAITAAQRASAHGQRDAKVMLPKVLANPDHYIGDKVYGDFAKAIIDDRDFVRPGPISYKIWGKEGIEQGAISQMDIACHMPNAVAASLMPDSHVGYSIPIGGVIALRNAVVPYAVGVDIACRVKLSILDIDPNLIVKQFNLFRESIEGGTNFGVGGCFSPRKSHPVMDENWEVTPVTKKNKDKAWNQLGTSGSGNHFASFGVLEFLFDRCISGVEFKKGQKYTAFMTHSGSRGTGSQVCDTYSGIAQARMPSKYADLGKLAWLDMDTEAGIEYWMAMNLMGEYAAANHEIIHKSVTKRLHVNVIADIENHHNWHGKKFIMAKR
jgi:tRNA-splicing ligase RtcB